MKKTHKTWLVAGLAFAVGLALAADYGVWDCNECTLNGPTPDDATITFIKVKVNEKVRSWRNKDTVTICNVTTCAKYFMVSVIGGVATMNQVDKYPRSQTGGGWGGEPGWGEGGWAGDGPFDQCFTDPGGNACVSVDGGPQHCEQIPAQLVCSGV